MRGYHETVAYPKPTRKRAYGWGCCSGTPGSGTARFQLRGLKVNGEAFLIAAGQNLKRLLRERDKGRRPFLRGHRGWSRHSLASPTHRLSRGHYPQTDRDLGTTPPTRAPSTD